MRYTIILLIVLTFPALCFSSTIVVPDDYPTIQDAIDAASGGDTVQVKSGTYLENIDFTGKAITVMSSNGPDVTVIDGNLSGSVVTFKSGEGLNSVLDGFKVTNGSGTIDPDYPQYKFIGGGIYCKKSSPTIMNNIVIGNLSDSSAGIACLDGSDPEIMKNEIIGNTAVGGGGGIGVAFDSDPEIVDNLILDNEAADSGGLGVIGNCSPVIRNNTISNNKANFHGGISLTQFCSGTVEGNIISENSASSSVGGIGCGSSSTTTISNNLIFGNTAGMNGGGISIYQNSNVTIMNNTIFGNSASQGGGIVCNVGASSTVVNTVLWNNSATSVGPEAWVGSQSTLTINYSDVDGGKPSVSQVPGSLLIWGPGMINANPLFVNAASDDFHLTYPSPCKDTGDNTAVTDFFDFEGDPRIGYGTVDMGADEFYTHLYWTGDATPGGNVELKFVGLPGTMPVGLILGTGVLDPSIPSMWGDWYLAFPIVGPIDLGSITSPDGVLIISGTIPALLPATYSIPMQALIGAELTNLSVLEI